MAGGFLAFSEVNCLDVATFLRNVNPHYIGDWTRWNSPAHAFEVFKYPNIFNYLPSQ